MTDLVVVLHQLDDDATLSAVVLHGDDPHDVGSVLSVGVSTVLETRVNISSVYICDDLIIQMAVVADSEKD